MIIPIIDVKTEKGRIETRPAQIMLVSMVQKITNLIVFLDFMQSEPVGDGISITSYRIYFIPKTMRKSPTNRAIQRIIKMTTLNSGFSVCSSPLKTNSMTNQNNIIWWPLMREMGWKCFGMEYPWIWLLPMILGFRCGLVDRDRMNRVNERNQSGNWDKSGTSA